MEQKCTLQELIDILNKQVYEQGFGQIAEIKLLDSRGITTYERT